MKREHSVMLKEIDEESLIIMDYENIVMHKPKKEFWIRKVKYEMEKARQELKTMDEKSKDTIKMQPGVDIPDTGREMDRLSLINQIKLHKVMLENLKLSCKSLYDGNLPDFIPCFADDIHTQYKMSMENNRVFNDNYLNIDMMYQMRIKYLIDYYQMHLDLLNKNSKDFIMRYDRIITRQEAMLYSDFDAFFADSVVKKRYKYLKVLLDQMPPYKEEKLWDLKFYPIEELDWEFARHVMKSNVENRYKHVVLLEAICEEYEFFTSMFKYYDVNDKYGLLELFYTSVALDNMIFDQLWEIIKSKEFDISDGIDQCDIPIYEISSNIAYIAGTIDINRIKIITNKNPYVVRCLIDNLPECINIRRQDTKEKIINTMEILKYLINTFNIEKIGLNEFYKYHLNEVFSLINGYEDVKNFFFA